MSFLLASLVFVLTSEMSSLELETYRGTLALAAREELRLVEKVRVLRQAIEKLPDTWRGSSLKAEGTPITKALFLKEIEVLELQTAERWAVIVENTSYMDRPEDSQAYVARRELLRIRQIQSELDRKLLELTLKVRDGQVLGLASQVLQH